MRLFIFIFLTIAITFSSCEQGQEEKGTEQYTGDYVCEINGQTLLILPVFKQLPPPPTTKYPSGSILSVTKTGDNELTLTLYDQILVAQVDAQGKLAIPATTIHLEDENFNMTLTATYSGTIRPTYLDIKQVATGTATCKYNGEILSLTATNTQWFEGIKK